MSYRSIFVLICMTFSFALFVSYCIYSYVATVSICTIPRGDDVGFISECTCPSLSIKPCLTVSRHRYESELSSNFGSGYAGALAASKKALCRGSDGADDSSVVFFYGDRRGNECSCGKCFSHRYGGSGVRMYEFLAYEIEGSTHRFSCPVKVDDSL